MNAMNMSHCVSQTSPCVPRNASADEPPMHRGEPLDELVARADRETERGDDREQPLPARERRSPQQDLTRDDRRHEPLREVADAVVVDFA